jgi:phosphate transport system substrate-binding protein
VGEITRSLALGFEGFTPGYTIKMGTAGTREGFALFCNDKTDIQQAVRVINGEESALCLRHGVNYLHITIAYDVLVVIGHAPVGECISATELAALYIQNTSHLGQALTWAEVRGGLPTTAVKVFAPPDETAAAQFFAERVLNGKPGVPVPDIKQLITGGDGLGYLPLAQARKLAGRLPILTVDSGGGCTAPSEESVWDNSYSYLSRPLYLYVNRESLRRSEVFRFMTYALSIPAQQRISDAGFLPAPPSVYRDVQTEIDHASQGS